MGDEPYGKEYFDRWYRHEGFGSPARLERKVRYALGCAEYLLDRPVRSVLDVGCGEGTWLAALRRHRPRVRYVGVDPSHYAVERFGARRNIRLGGLGNLAACGIDDVFDLVVCADVVAYAVEVDLRRGLRTIASILEGVALVELFTSVDSFEGDLDGHYDRKPGQYERWFTEAGLVRIGPNLFAGERLLPSLSAFERGTW